MFKATVTINPFRCNKNQAAVTGSTLVTALILITPFCGYVFQCGCTWPWAGLDSACNIHDPAAQQRCPWCASLLAGWLSSVVSVLTGVLAASLFRTRFFSIKPAIDIAIRYALGLAIFAATAFLSAAMAAKAQHYPIGLFGFDTLGQPDGLANKSIISPEIRRFDVATFADTFPAWQASPYDIPVR